MKPYGMKRPDLDSCCYGPTCCGRFKNPETCGLRANRNPLVKCAKKRARNQGKVECQNVD